MGEGAKVYGGLNLELGPADRQTGPLQTSGVARGDAPCGAPGKIVKKWPENASREVNKKSKIFLPRRRGHPFSWTPSPFGPRFFPPRPCSRH